MKNGLIIKEIKFTKQNIAALKEGYLINYPTVYFISQGPDGKIGYVGETSNVKNRLVQHLKNEKRSGLTDVIVIGNKKFNQSATYNIESNLINMILSEEKFELQNTSKTSNFRMHNYYNKEYYDEIMFKEIWKKLTDLGYTKNDIDTLKNKDIYKISPYTSLTEEQYNLKREIINFAKECIEKNTKGIYIVQGEAGTGKSVLLSSIFNEIQESSIPRSGSRLEKSKNFFLVNHKEVLKTYKRIARKIKVLKVNDFLKPTEFINKKEKCDIVIIDEAHLLLSSKDKYNNFNQNNQLEEIIKKSKVVIAMFDEKQFLKIKSYWDVKTLEKITKNIPTKKHILKEQFRMSASKEIIQWIDEFIYEGKINKVPKKTENFEFKVFKNPNEIYDKIKEKDTEYSLSRVVATFDYEHKKDGKEYYVTEKSFSLPWNRNYDKVNQAWAEIPTTINEVGSIYTVQGFDLNYVGIIVGPSFYLDKKTQKIGIKSEKYQDKEAFRVGKEKQLTNQEKEEIKIKIIKNSLNVLMKRAKFGIYVYFADEAIYQKIKSLNSKK